MSLRSIPQRSLTLLLVVQGRRSPSRSGSAQRIGRSRPRPATDVRARVSLRLDEPHHRRLRLAAAHLHKSAQAVLQAALDHYLDHIVPTVIDGRCLCLGRRRRATGARFTPGPVRSAMSAPRPIASLAGVAVRGAPARRRRWTNPATSPTASPRPCRRRWRPSRRRRRAAPVRGAGARPTRSSSIGSACAAADRFRLSPNSTAGWSAIPGPAA